MKKRKLHDNFISIIFCCAVLSAISLLFPTAVLSQKAVSSIATDGYESKNFSGGIGWRGNWTKEGRVALVRNNPYEGKRYVRISGGNSAGYLERGVNLSNVSSVRLKFASRVKSFESRDKAYVRVSPDGIIYTMVAEFTSADSDNRWHSYDIDLSAYTMSADFRIVFEGDMGHKTKDKWFIDDIEVVGDGGSSSGDKTFTITAVKDNLDNEDMYIMARKLTALGYTQRVADTNVTKAELISYLQQDTTTLYHTGHGNTGTVATANNGTLKPNSTTVNVGNTIWATCLTLKNTGWRNAFGPGAETISGYTKVSLDFVDEDVVRTFATQLGKGKSYPVAWYLANNGINSLSDRWCIYARKNGSIVEYSARNNTVPQNDDEKFVAIDKAGKVKVSGELLNTVRRYKSSFADMRVEAASMETQTNPDGFAMLQKTELSEADAIAAVEAYLDDLGEMSSDMMLDLVYSIQSRTSDDDPHVGVGWVVRFVQQAHTGLFVRGNGIEPHKTVVITNAGDVMAFSKYWPSLTAAPNHGNQDMMDVSEALRTASESISDRVKQSIHIEAVEPVHGIASAKGQAQELFPAYGFSTSDNVVIVVNARTGELLD